MAGQALRIAVIAAMALFQEGVRVHYRRTRYYSNDKMNSFSIEQARRKSRRAKAQKQKR